MTKQNLFARVSAAAATIGLLAAPLAFAAANEITTVDFASDAALSADLAGNSFTFTAPAASALAEGDVISVRVPSDMTIGTFAAGDATFASSATSIAGGTIAYDTVSQEVTYTLDSDDVIDVADTVTVTFPDNDAAFVTSPATAGQYAFSIRMDDTDGTVLATGAALLAVSNDVAITATVQEALVLTIGDLSINLNVDPAANEGRDYSQKTTLTGKTNAQSGYKIQGALDNTASSTNELYNTDASHALTGGNPTTTENTFGYAAYNADVIKTQAEIASEAGSGAAAFAASAANLGLYTGSGDIEAVAPTNEQIHTVYYIVNVDFLTPAGKYEGTITYTAVPTF